MHCDSSVSIRCTGKAVAVQNLGAGCYVALVTWLGFTLRGGWSCAGMARCCQNARQTCAGQQPGASAMMHGRHDGFMS
jgi:hypothetical protein